MLRRPELAVSTNSTGADTGLYLDIRGERAARADVYDPLRYAAA